MSKELVHHNIGVKVALHIKLSATQLWAHSGQLIHRSLTFDTQQSPSQDNYKDAVVRIYIVKNKLEALEGNM